MVSFNQEFSQGKIYNFNTFNKKLINRRGKKSMKNKHAQLKKGKE